MFFDVHSHNNFNLNKNCIINIFPQNLSNKNINSNNFYSIGLHPKDITDKELSRYIETIKKKSSQKNILAIGEIGLDRYYPNFGLQKTVFEELLAFSEEIKKPIIIHCVKSYSEILHYRNKYSKTHWILHGFRGKKELCKQLLSAGIYISFGPAILNSSNSLMDTVKTVPANKVLFETDESELNIKNIYSAFADINNINLEQLSVSVNKTLKDIFGDSII